MRLSQAIEGFVVSRLADGYAHVTLRGYNSALGTLGEYISDPEVDAITTDQLKDFFHYLRTKYKPERKNGSTEPLATASYHRYWKAIRSFFKWAAEELKTGRPDLAIKMPKYSNKEIVPFSEDEVRRLLKACERSAPVNDGKRKEYRFARPAAIRDRALILTLLETGLRSGECARLKIAHVNLDNGEVFVMPHHLRKTRSRTVYLGKAARKAIWRYLATRPDARPGDPLFTTIEGRPMTQATIRSVITTIANAAGVPNAHPHKFRHTFAIMYLRNGGDVFTLQRLGGWATLEMVRHYLALADSDAGDAHRRASPADNWRL